MDTFFMLAQTDRAIKPSIALLIGERVDKSTWKGGEFEVVGSDMTLEGLMLAESFITTRISRTSVTLVALVSLLMSSESRSSQEALVTSFPITNPFPLLSMRAFNVLLQMFVFDVRFVAAIIRTFERTLVGMSNEMCLHSCWAIEGLGTSYEGALDCLVF